MTAEFVAAGYVTIVVRGRNRRMKVGIFITNQHRLATDMVGALEEQFVMVRHARDRGWDSLMTGQHYLNEGDNKQLQAVPLLARLPAGAGGEAEREEAHA